MQQKQGSLILILLGIIILAFPVIGVIPFSFLTGVIVSLLGAGLLVGGIIMLREKVGWAIVGIISGILVLILGIGFIVNPSLFSFVASLFVILAGLMFIAAGIATIAGIIDGDNRAGIVTLVIGIIYLIIGSWIADPELLGTLIGIWLLITGFIMLFRNN
ncbi:DUF308 domain-containing protein [Methanobacterium alkalithermotolerans]|uniref:DUF308 domain-containing protein n=1 Tax=Methanobacterium alkalithermotolerans TaxID=2731220 RepID=A0A8T8KFD3_9EURY|nr:DUF308 domain-containing protein [Methanobacterium alkalithermotolerans]QUH23991.1 DUF308 domain-containing protein [Methanobacterium alkalithermotolerans]